MDEIKYKVLKDFGSFKEGDIVNANADELVDLTEEEMTDLLANGTLEVVVDAPAPTPEVQPEAPKDDPKPESPKEEVKDEPVLRAGKGKFKITGEVAIKDSNNQTQGHYQVGTVYEFDNSVGDHYVSLGLAEEVVED